MSPEFNVQQALESMEGRVLARFDALDARLTEQAVDGGRVDERVTALEEQARWIGWGAVSAIVGVLALAIAYVRKSLNI